MTDTNIDRTALIDKATASGNRVFAAGEAFADAQTEYADAYTAWLDVNREMHQAGMTEDEMMDVARGVLRRGGMSEEDLAETEAQVQAYFTQLKAAEDENLRQLL